MKTVYLKPEEAPRSWYLIDAEGQRLGRVAVKVACMLRAKHRPYFSMHQEIGDFIVVVNAAKIEVSGRKREAKIYYKHTGYPGGLKDYTFNELIGRDGRAPLELAVKGMLPKGPLGRKLLKNLKIYAGAEHPHAAQKPEAITL